MRNTEKNNIILKVDPASKDAFLDKWASNTTVYDKPKFHRDTLDISV